MSRVNGYLSPQIPINCASYSVNFCLGWLLGLVESEYDFLKKEIVIKKVNACARGYFITVGRNFSLQINQLLEVQVRLGKHLSNLRYFSRPIE